MDDDGPGRADDLARSAAAHTSDDATPFVPVTGDDLAPEAGDARRERSPDGRLARVHLRLGAHGLARAELEALAGRGALDDDALLDLAEVRWRTGDLTGAGEAAQAYLGTGRDDAVALVIAAEAAAALGRPGEARRLATRAIAAADRPLDAIFAGIAKSAVWPNDPIHGEQAATLFPTSPARASAPGVRATGTPAMTAPVAREDRSGRVDRTAGEDRSARAAAAGPWTNAAGPWTNASRAAVAEPAPDAGSWLTDEPGFWTDDVPAAPDPLPDAASELDAARAALELDDHRGAALRLALALRIDPAAAPAVLDIAGGHRGPDLEMVRGDALRLVGHEAEARRAYAAAAGAIGRPADAPD